MAEYKVIFRTDVDCPDNQHPITWEQGCPLMFKAIQISRDTESGKAFLQTKVGNLSSTVVSSFKAKLICHYKDNNTEEFETEPLDADIEACSEYALKPITLSKGDAVYAEVGILSVNMQGKEWKSSTDAESLPKRILLALSEEALAERVLLLQERGCEKANEAAPYSCVEHDSWVQCSCGQVSMGCEVCLSCGIRLSGLKEVEDSDFLLVSLKKREERKRKLDEDKEKRKDERAWRLKKIAPKIAAFIAITAMLCFAVGLFINNSKYDTALAKEESGDYEEALHGFSEIPGFKDSSSHLKALLDQLIFSKNISISKAIEYLEFYPNGNDDLLRLCKDIAIVEDGKYKHGGKYEFYADYYLAKGIPSANVKYSNYLGIFEDGALVTSSSDSNYLINIAAKGSFKTNTTEFVFKVGEKKGYAEFVGGGKYELVFS